MRILLDTCDFLWFISGDALRIQRSFDSAVSGGALVNWSRRRILANQARQAEALYRQNPELIAEEADAPLSYE